MLSIDLILMTKNLPIGIWHKYQIWEMPEQIIKK